MRTLLLRVAIGVVALAVISGGGFAVWRTFFFHPPKVAATKAPSAPKKPVASATPTYVPIALPADAPKIGANLEARVVYPFAKRLAEVNRLAKKMIVTVAEYHDSDAGQRYFTAVVTSCKELDEIWPIARGVC